MAKVDDKAPSDLTLEIRDPESGQVWGTATLKTKFFSTGSKGFFCSTKLTNPLNSEARYQCNFQMILLGSKEE